MKLQKVKINPHNRVKILCSRCNETNFENESYADLDSLKPFVYYCRKCVGDMMVNEGINIGFEK